jgi:hypothetical protein
MVDTSPRTIRRLVGVYDADGTVRGELAYFVGARLGRAHCALCDITHGLVRERADWRLCRDGLRVPFDAYHRNDQPDTIRVATSDVAPVVVAETDTGIVSLLSPDALHACAGSPALLVEAIERAVEREVLRWPAE